MCLLWGHEPHPWWGTHPLPDLAAFQALGLVVSGALSMEALSDEAHLGHFGVILGARHPSWQTLRIPNVASRQGTGGLAWDSLLSSSLAQGDDGDTTSGGVQETSGCGTG